MSAVTQRPCSLLPVKIVTEGDISYALSQMGYSEISRQEGVVHFLHPDAPEGPLQLDFSKGPIPQDLLEPLLEQQGINLDAFHAFLPA